MGYLKVGQLSKLFKINKQTLQYYDRIDLLIPTEVDEETGYRKYSSNQIYELATIRYLKKIGYSLDEISDYMRYKDPKKTLESLERHSEILLKQSEELLKIRKAIQRKIEFTREQLQDLDTEKVTLKKMPTRYYISIGEEDSLYRNNSFYFFPTIAFYDEEFKSFGAYIGNSLEEIEKENEIHSDASLLLKIDAGTFLVGYHVGPYEDIMKRVDQIRDTYSDLKLDSRTIHFNVIDQFLDSHKENYITEINIKIEES